MRIHCYWGALSALLKYPLVFWLNLACCWAGSHWCGSEWPDVLQGHRWVFLQGAKLLRHGVNPVSSVTTTISTTFGPSCSWFWYKMSPVFVPFIPFLSISDPQQGESRIPSVASFFSWEENRTPTLLYEAYDWVVFQNNSIKFLLFQVIISCIYHKLTCWASYQSLSHASHLIVTLTL